MNDDSAGPTNNLKPGDIPAAAVTRDKERNIAGNILSRGGSQHLYLYGPRGAGKTLFTHHLLRDFLDERNICYLSGITDDTQYKVLARLAAVLAGTEIGSGYHTVQLYNQVAACLHDQETVVVLDDIEFLLLNDGNDLLYSLSRLEQGTALNIVAVSANYPDLTATVDERTYSSLQPQRIAFEPYTADQATRILAERAQRELGQPVTNGAVSEITAATANITLGLHWLVQAAAATDDVITADVVQTVQTAAVQRYRDRLLTDFSTHHHRLLEAIEQLTAGTEPTTSGAVYDRYETLSTAAGGDPFTRRRVSDFLTQLELLGIIDVDYHRGGTLGKTREIQLTSPLEQV